MIIVIYSGKIIVERPRINSTMTVLLALTALVVFFITAPPLNRKISISGLQTVPEDVYEAGGLDGATGWKQFKLLTFPLIIPFFSINMVLKFNGKQI